MGLCFEPGEGGFDWGLDLRHKKFILGKRDINLLKISKSKLKKLETEVINKGGVFNLPDLEKLHSGRITIERPDGKGTDIYGFEASGEDYFISYGGSFSNSGIETPISPATENILHNMIEKIN